MLEPSREDGCGSLQLPGVRILFGINFEGIDASNI
jgi:hypothetical protein